MNDGQRDWIERLESGEALSVEMYGELIRFRDADMAEMLRQGAQRVWRSHTRGKLYVFGTVDLSTYCKNDCFYCGLRRENRFAQRYRMRPEEIIACCVRGAQQGICHFLLQGGEDPGYAPEQIGRLIGEIRKAVPGSVVFLALGEKSRSVYRRWKQAGAQGYFLCHETVEDKAYRRLHPPQMSLLCRKQCLWELKELGFLVGSGWMTGTPYQKIGELAEEFGFLQQLEPDLALVGNFIPAEGTPFAAERGGAPELACYMLSLLRLTFPRMYLPVMQSLQLADRDAVLRAVQSGADVLMTDLTPPEYRSRYHCVPKRLQRGKTGVEEWGRMQERLREAGYEIAGADETIRKR